MKGATEAELKTLESSLGQSLGDQLTALLSEENGFERWYGETYLMIYSAKSIAEMNIEHRSFGTHPGLLIFGSDGSRELFGIDTRSEGAMPVVMVDITSEGWHAAITQAPSLEAFMDQRRLGMDLIWEASSGLE